MTLPFREETETVPIARTLLYQQVLDADDGEYQLHSSQIFG